MSNKVRKKPTIKEITNVVLELNQRQNGLYQMFIDLEKAFSLYIEMMEHDDKFKKYIDKKVEDWKKKNDTKADGNADKPNLQGDTDGESSGSKRVRKKKG